MGFTSADITDIPPKGILKNAAHASPPVTPASPDQSLSAKEVTIANTHYNAGNRRSLSSSSRRRASSHTPSASGQDLESSQRLKWDEANLYLTEQERTPKMKIDEPKTPWATGHGALDDFSDGEGGPCDIPGLELGEPERKVPERRLSDGSQKVVHVDDAGADHDVDMEDMSTEEREKHEKFEEMRRSHYEMRSAVQLLGHPEELMDEVDEDEEADKPPVPSIPQNLPNTNGSS